MKRKNEEVPGFDEIIFKDRNKEYGAYRIRKGYNKSLGISLLGGVALAVALVVLPSLTSPKGSTLPDHTIVVIAPDPDLEKMLQVETPVEKKAPAEIINPNRYLAPRIVDDTMEISNTLLPNDMQADLTVDGVATENPVEPGDGDIGPEIPPEPTKYISVPEMPEFPGGNIALLKYIADNIVYPVEALENQVVGKVTLRFVVTPDGTVDEIEVLKSTGNAEDLSVLEKEALRVIRTLPVWEPGKMNGIPVHVYFTVPVTFSIKSF